MKPPQSPTIAEANREHFDRFRDVMRRMSDSSRQKDSLEGMCVELSFIVKEFLGGCILFGVIHGTGHYWNRLPDNSEVDLTSCQFGGDGFTPLGHGVSINLEKLAYIPTAIREFVIEYKRLINVAA